jgi:uncharacterized protein (TIGR02145 family)
MKTNFFLLTAALFIIAFSSSGQETGTFTDARDGKTYKTVKIGTQTWMAENLNYETDSSCCYDFDKNNCDKCGRLYTYNDAIKSCPIGWHIPSESEWIKLRDYLGGNKAVDKIRGQTFGLLKPNNSSGFTALPCGLGGFDFNSKYFFGIVESDGRITTTSLLLSFRGLNSYASFWSSDIKGNKGRAFCITCSAVKAYSKMTNEKLYFGLSVRCIKD